jgi:hypothetical protein
MISLANVGSVVVILLTGLVGAVVGGAVVAFEARRRWHKENEAAARLLHTEVVTNVGWLEGLSKHKSAAVDSLVRDVWDAEQVRIASLLSSKTKDLMTVITAYESLSPLLRRRKEWAGLEQLRSWLESPAARPFIMRALVMFREAEKVLVRRVPPPDPKLIAEWQRKVDEAMAKSG